MAFSPCWVSILEHDRSRARTRTQPQLGLNLPLEVSILEHDRSRARPIVRNVNRASLDRTFQSSSTTEAVLDAIRARDCRAPHQQLFQSSSTTEAVLDLEFPRNSARAASRSDCFNPRARQKPCSTRRGRARGASRWIGVFQSSSTTEAVLDTSHVRVLRGSNATGRFNPRARQKPCSTSTATITACPEINSRFQSSSTTEAVLDSSYAAARVLGSQSCFNPRARQKPCSTVFARSRSSPHVRVCSILEHDRSRARHRGRLVRVKLEQPVSILEHDRSRARRWSERYLLTSLTTQSFNPRARQKPCSTRNTEESLIAHMA